ncbi:glycosyltransferase family A protein [Chryseolinea lacunae]|uniref:Glycosyltransferase family 2 protein n=1 Tax=Chryseolinea lacunae TaxID=2801331 RepID=A0ABS1KNP6_9BACT|nr:glycosyltransferase family 2 protein [Chryseolinea lacunae]
MNRLIHVKETLRKNIEDNQDYPNVEFVLLDYNSNDGLQDWIKMNMRKYIDENILRYFRLNSPQYFRRSHAKNVAFSLSTGDIVCNVDADNFTGPRFADYVNKIFSKEKNTVLTGIPVNHASIKSRDVLGRLAVPRKTFMNVRGFDETMHAYGFEDFDLVERLHRKGLKRSIIRGKHFLSAISHGFTLRIKNEYFLKFAETLYMHFSDPTNTIIIVLYTDNRCERVHIANKSVLHSPVFDTPMGMAALISIRSNEAGSWIKDNSGRLVISWSQGSEIFIQDDINSKITSKNGSFVKIDSTDMFLFVSTVMSEVSNRLVFRGNNRKNITAVNKNGFGKFDERDLTT